MTVLKAFPGAQWVGSKRAGKPWVGTTEPMVVLHTLEFNSFPDPDRWDSPSHIVVNPNNGEIRQYLPMDRAAYAVRDNPLEDDAYTWQVELWGIANNVPNYNDRWYQGVAKVCDIFVQEYGIPPVFKTDFNLLTYGAYAPARMTHEQTDAFSGFLGHGHMGRGVDEHWDPGKLNIDRVTSFMEEQTMADIYPTWVAGWVKGLAEGRAKTEQEFTRLNTEQQSDGGYVLEPANDPATVKYFMDLLDDPYNEEWPGFYARTQLAVWGR